MPLGLEMIPLEPSVSDATIWSITLESSFTILEASFYDRNMFILKAGNTKRGSITVPLL